MPYNSFVITFSWIQKQQLRISADFSIKGEVCFALLITADVGKADF